MAEPIELNELNEGDKIRLERGDEAYEGRVELIDGLLKLRASGLYVKNMLDWGWKLSRLERAKPPLPTESGWYFLQGKGALRLTDYGAWYWNGREFPVQQVERWASYQLITKLEPVSETVNKIADWLDKTYPRHFVGRVVREQFGTVK